MPPSQPQPQISSQTVTFIENPLMQSKDQPRLCLIFDSNGRTYMFAETHLIGPKKAMILIPVAILFRERLKALNPFYPQPDLKLGIASHMDPGVLTVLRIAATHVQSTGPCCKSRQLFLLVYDELSLPGLKDSNKIDRCMSVMKTNNNNKSMLLRTQIGEFDYNRWLFETKSTYGNGNAFWPQDVMYGCDEGDVGLQGGMVETADKPLENQLNDPHAS
ncbi:hypothetical protein NE237_021181 [Protea cynaroides]|uniref:Uncharacterized protein n=1 Tax=Protea cynaroides TaxID=273540 RepID=A0A9Q0H9S8_9MAGN|nr:hypothetical protein NE237_021181 [Protea cynaroides]